MRGEGEMGNPVEGRVLNTPSVGQQHGLLAEWLTRRGRITMPEAGRVAGGLMLGDWNQLPMSERDRWMRRAQQRLENLSGVMPVYALKWPVDATRRRVVRVWYYTGREPAVHLQADLARPGCEAD